MGSDSLNFIFTDNLYKLSERININLFCSSKFNKIIVLCNTVLNVKIPRNIKLIYADGIMLVAPYNLSKFICDGKDNFNLFGPGSKKDLINWVISYYSYQYNSPIGSIQENFFYTNHFLPYEQYHSDISNINNKQSVTPLLDKKIVDKKILFSTGYGLIWGGKQLELFKKNQEILADYLERGNYLVLVESTGHHIGIPFDSSNQYYYDYYYEMVKFFQNLCIQPQQVFDFKTTFVGINYNGDSINFGWYKDPSLIVNLYLNYIKSNELYAVDGFINCSIAKKVEKLGGESLQINPINNKEITNQFHNFMKYKVLKK